MRRALPCGYQALHFPTMRQIGSIDDEQQAQRLGDYLLTQGLRNHVEKSASGMWDLWVEDDDLLERGRTELQHFRNNPDDPRFAVAAAAPKLRKEAEKAEQRRAKQFVDVRTRWSTPSQFVRPVTIALVAISIIISLGTKLGMGEFTQARNALLIEPLHLEGEHWVAYNGLNAIQHGQIWRVITPIFLHTGPLHLIFNMFWVLDLGSMIETRRSSLFLLLLVIVTAAGSNVAEYYLPNPANPNPMFGGMSGVVYALFGYAWIKGKCQPYLGIGLPQQTVTFMLFWLVLCMTGLVGPIANVAHVGGLLGGVLFAYVPYLWTRLRRR
jgi:GlpG protein